MTTDPREKMKGVDEKVRPKKRPALKKATGKVDKETADAIVWLFSGKW